VRLGASSPGPEELDQVVQLMQVVLHRRRVRRRRCAEQPVPGISTRASSGSSAGARSSTTTRSKDAAATLSAVAEELGRVHRGEEERLLPPRRACFRIATRGRTCAGAPGPTAPQPTRDEDQGRCTSRGADISLSTRPASDRLPQAHLIREERPPAHPPEHGRARLHLVLVLLDVVQEVEAEEPVEAAMQGVALHAQSDSCSRAASYGPASSRCTRSSARVPRGIAARRQGPVPAAPTRPPGRRRPRAARSKRAPSRARARAGERREPPDPVREGDLPVTSNPSRFPHLHDQPSPKSGAARGPPTRKPGERGCPRPASQQPPRLPPRRGSGSGRSGVRRGAPRPATDRVDDRANPPKGGSSPPGPPAPDDRRAR